MCLCSCAPFIDFTASGGHSTPRTVMRATKELAAFHTGAPGAAASARWLKNLSTSKRFLRKTMQQAAEGASSTEPPPAEEEGYYVFSRDKSEFLPIQKMPWGYLHSS